MNVRLVVRVVAILLVVISAFMLFPILVAWYYGEKETISSFFIPILIALSVSVTVLLSTHRQYGSLSSRDGFMLVSLSWVAVTAVGALPFVISGAIPHYVDAFFETMSGFTTTGASILTDIESLPRSILFWRSLTHWLGGMGIIVLTVAIFPILGIGGLQLIRAEAPGPSVDKITSRVTETAKILWITYLILTAAETLLLLLGGLDLFDSLTHTFGTLATGGFSPKNASVGFYQSGYVHVVITVFMILAGINFALYFSLVTGRTKAVFLDTELKSYLLVFGVAAVLVTGSLYVTGTYTSIGESLRFASFQSASILTTTGYVTADYASWPHFAQMVLVALMFFGGCSGSTGGGMKIVRIVALVKLGFSEMKYLLHSRGVFTFRMSGVALKKNIVYAVAGFVVLYLGILVITALVVASAGNDVITSVTTALATLGNIGPGLGGIGPTSNYAFFPSAIKWFLSFIMMLGRLELFTVLILFTPRFWRP